MESCGERGDKDIQSALKTKPYTETALSVDSELIRIRLGGLPLVYKENKKALLDTIFF